MILRFVRSREAVSLFSSIFRKKKPPVPQVPAGDRVYAVGDVHGCADQFEALLREIATDNQRRGPARTKLVLLGDLVDRGPDVRRVVERALAIARSMPFALIKGNHEEMLLRAAEGHRPSLQMFNRYGGRETLLSYGVDPEAYDEADFDQLGAMIAAAIPAEHLAFLSAGLDHIVIGDYRFVHAGVRPGVPLEEQAGTDLRWIRDPFLSHRGSFGCFVIHGHTITAVPDVQPNRIGIDTGAYSGGKLTAIGLEGDKRWFLTA